MKRIFTVLGIAVLLVSQLNSQTSNTLSAVQFVNANTVVACGAAGTFVRSNDAGLSWTSYATGVSDYLLGVSFPTTSIGTLVGGTPLLNTQAIVRTSDGGLNWLPQSGGSTRVLKGVSFVDVNTGWAVGNSGTIIKTTNGGLLWSAQTSGITENIQEVQFLDANVGTAVGDYGRILRTTNGGSTWVIQTSGTNIFLYGVRFVNSTIGTVVGNAGTILRTTNAGASWSAQSSGTTQNLTSVYFVDANNGWVSGNTGTIRRTTNGGATWAAQTSGTTADLGGIAFRDLNTGIVVGINGTILRTSNGGATWAAPVAGGYVTSQYPVLAGWNIVSVPMTVLDARKTAVFPTATSSAFAYTASGYVPKDTLENGVGYWLMFPSAQDVTITGTLRTRDTVVVMPGWNSIGTISDPVLVSAIQQIPPGIVKSQFFGYNGGYTGTDVLMPARGYWVFSEAPGLLVMSSPSLPGKVTSPLSSRLENAGSLEFTDIGRSSQTLFFTSEEIDQRELDHYKLPPTPPAGVFDVRFATNRMLESVTEGQERRVHVHVSSAAYPLTISWDMKDQAVSASLQIGGEEIQLSAVGSVTVGDPESPLMLRFSSTPSLPQEFALSQNYPNPFNPSTTIHYTLPHASFVKLVVYNIIGQQIAQLVSEQQRAGNHDVVFHGNDLASGVYFYRLEAGDLVATKRLLLLK